MRRFWRKVLAYFRISLTAVCEESRGMGHADYHDYHDDAAGQPWHFAPLKCERCGKEFII